jgi:hypothetical protein
VCIHAAACCRCCRHESELKDNNYWLGLLTHLQSPDVPYKRVECLRDLRSMYECATIDDLYDAYTRFDFSDEAVFTCVGTSGKAPPPPPDRARLDALVSQLDGSARGTVQSAGWGAGPSSSSSSSSGPGGAALPVDWAAAFSKAFGAAMQQQAAAAQGQVQQQQLQQPAAPSQQQEQQQQQEGKPDPMAMFTAMLAAAQGAKLAQALGKEKQQQEQQNGDGNSS